MNTTDLNNIADDLYMLLLSLNKKIFNPEEIIKAFEFPPSHVKVLFYLIHHGSSSISEIGNDLMISKPNMTPIIDKLESEGFIKRFNDVNDRRIIRIETTEKACLFFKKQELVIKKHLANKISPLSTEDTTELFDSVKKMKEIIAKL